MKAIIIGGLFTFGAIGSGAYAALFVSMPILAWGIYGIYSRNAKGIKRIARRLDN